MAFAFAFASATAEATTKITKRIERLIISNLDQIKAFSVCSSNENSIRHSTANMRRVRVTTSAVRICTFLVLLVLKLQALLFYEKTTHAFSPSPLSASIQPCYTPLFCTTRRHSDLDSSRLKLAATTTDGGATATTNPGNHQNNHTTESESESQLPIRYDPARIRFRCRIAYDGTSFAGFQLQGGRKGSNAQRNAKKAAAEVDDDDNDNDDSSSSMSKFERKQQRKNDRYKSSNIRTIQGEVEKILSKRFQRLVKVVGAGRTDGGVHARGQAIHFDLYRNETRTGGHGANGDDDDDNDALMLLFERNLETTVNRMLPSDIRAWNLGRASPDLVLADATTDSKGKDKSNNTKQMSSPPPPGYYNWNAMRSCTSKLYSYRICISDAMNPSERHRRWQLPWQGVDAANVERLLRNFEGEHDFCCFAGALEQQERKTGFAMSTVRTIHKIKMVPEINSNNNHNKDDMGGVSSQNYYRIDIYLDGALYKMVRNIVGAVIDVARDGGWLEEETLLDLLHRPSESNYTRKDNPSKPAPSYGLTLERVFYPDETF